MSEKIEPDRSVVRNADGEIIAESKDGVEWTRRATGDPVSVEIGAGHAAVLANLLGDRSTLDVHERARRLRACWIALKRPGMSNHAEAMAAYREIMQEDIAGLTDPTVEGSWGWWADEIAGVHDA